MHMAHLLASSMGGIRAAGDLVARMQLSKKMRIDEAKKYVADKLHVTPLDLSDPDHDAASQGGARHRDDHGRARHRQGHRRQGAHRQLLDIEINCVEQFKKKTGLHY